MDSIKFNPFFTSHRNFFKTFAVSANFLTSWDGFCLVCFSWYFANPKSTFDSDFDSNV